MHEYFFDPIWWMSVIAAGVIYSTISHYLMGGLSQVGSKLSDRWRQRNAKRIEARKRLIETCRAEETARFMVGFSGVVAGLAGLAAMSTGALLIIADLLLLRIATSHRTFFAISYLFGGLIFLSGPPLLYRLFDAWSVLRVALGNRGDAN